MGFPSVQTLGAHSSLSLTLVMHMLIPLLQAPAFAGLVFANPAALWSNATSWIFPGPLSLKRPSQGHHITLCYPTTSRIHFDIKSQVRNLAFLLPSPSVGSELFWGHLLKSHVFLMHWNCYLHGILDFHMNSYYLLTELFFFDLSTSVLLLL